MGADYSKKIQVTGATLKIIALITMLVDHTAAVLIGQISGPTDIYWAMRLIGRMAFPIYCFLLVEGACHTRNQYMYALRLLLFAFISEIPFDLALRGKAIDNSYNNVFFTLLIGLLSIIVIGDIRKLGERAKKKSTPMWFLVTFGKYLATAAVIMAAMLVSEFVIRSDYGAAGVACIVTMYLLWNHKEAAFLAGVLILGLLTSDMELAALLMLIPVHFYKGERGHQIKYLFYGFYPVHLMVLYLIGRYVL